PTAAFRRRIERILLSYRGRLGITRSSLHSIEYARSWALLPAAAIMPNSEAAGAAISTRLGAHAFDPGVCSQNGPATAAQRTLLPWIIVMTVSNSIWTSKNGDIYFV